MYFARKLVSTLAYATLAAANSNSHSSTGSSDSQGYSSGYNSTTTHIGLGLLGVMLLGLAVGCALNSCKPCQRLFQSRREAQNTDGFAVMMLDDFNTPEELPAQRPQ